MIRRITMFLLVFAICMMVLWLSGRFDTTLTNQVMTYYNENAFQDTGSTNVVTAIYLNYRVYDTLFEALMLLISILAVVYFSRHEGHEYEL